MNFLLNIVIVGFVLVCFVLDVEAIGKDHGFRPKPILSISFNDKINSENNRVLLSFDRYLDDGNLEKKNFYLEEMVSVFGNDAELIILDGNKDKNIVKPLKTTAKSYMMSPSTSSNNDQNSKEWGIFTIHKDETDPTKHVIHGVYTIDNGSKIMQIDHIDKHKDEIHHSNYRKLQEDATSGHSVFEVNIKDIPAFDTKSNLRSDVRCGNGDKDKDNTQKHEDIKADDTTVPFGEYIPFFPGCFDGDALSYEFNIGIAVDVGFYKAVGSDITRVQSEIADMISSTRIVYLKQLNIIPVVQKLVITTSTTEAFPLNMSPSDGTCITAMDYVLDQFGRWNGNNNDGVAGREQGHWHLLTNCWPPPGTVGLSNMNSLCDKTRNVGLTSRISPTQTWLIFAHELGHGFGASHSFGIGGLMDYGNYNYNGIPQFDFGKKPEMCSEINSVISTCKHFVAITGDTKCGNNVIEEGEDCECLTFGSKSCGGCVNCKLANSNIKCSASTFQMRTTKADFLATTIIVKSDSLSDSECCSASGEMYTPMTSCNGGKDSCVTGKCKRVCSAYNLATCTVINNGCTQPCNYMGTCTSTLTTVGGVKISWVPDGTYCGLNKECVQGQCKPASSTTTSDAPTPGSVTRAPTTKPTSKPSDRPSKNPTTSKPTKAPTTGKPTAVPTTRRPTTLPTFKPTKTPTTGRPTKPPTTKVPTKPPTNKPSKVPTTVKPTIKPTIPTSSPTVLITRYPTRRTG